MKFIFENDYILIQPEGMEHFWSLCSKIRIKKSSIISCTWHESFRLPYDEIGLRVGTGMPGVLVAGWFFSKFGKIYLYLKRSKYTWTALETKNTLDIQLKSKVLQRVCVNVPDEQEAKEVCAWASKQDYA